MTCLRSLSGLAFALALGAPALSADPCGLVGRNDVAAVLGGPVLAATPAGPMRDAATGGRLTMCTYDAAASSVVVSVTAFVTAELAGKAATTAYVAGRLEGSGASVSEEGGLGDRAFFGSSSAGARWVVLRGTNIVEVAIAGSGSKPLASAKGRLRGLVSAALGGS
jgi:hypothetical protein